MLPLFGHKVVQAGLQSGTIMSVADLATQCCLGGDQRLPSMIDWDRTLRWSVAGLLLHGPYFFLGFSCLDAVFGAATHWSTVAKKTVTAQLVLFPPYLTLLFSYMAVAEGQRSLTHVAEKVQQKVPQAFLGGSVFWPIVNAINFTFVTQTFRMPFLAACGAVWNSYLSWANARKN